MVASAPMRNSTELSRRQALYRVPYGEGGSFSRWPGIGGILWPDFRVSSEIGGICDLILGFLLCRAELGYSLVTLLMAMGGFCGWSLAVGGP